MLHWQFLLVIGVIFLIIEIIAPMVFFLNFAIAAFFTAVAALFIVDWNILVPVFLVFSALFLIFLRPILLKSKNGDKKTGVEEKYIGKVAKVTETVSPHAGVVSIYNERWEARSSNNEEIQVGEEVKIIKNESLLLYVERL